MTTCDCVFFFFFLFVVRHCDVCMYIGLRLNSEMDYSLCVTTSWTVSSFHSYAYDSKKPKLFFFSHRTSMTITTIHFSFYNFPSCSVSFRWECTNQTKMELNTIVYQLSGVWTKKYKLYRKKKEPYLTSAYDICFCSEHIDDLPFAFITPLCAWNIPHINIWDETVDSIVCFCCFLHLNAINENDLLDLDFRNADFVLIVLNQKVNKTRRNVKYLSKRNVALKLNDV